MKVSVGIESLKNNKHPNEVAWLKGKANSGKNTNIKDSKDIETYSDNKCKFCPSNYLIVLFLFVLLSFGLSCPVFFK